MKKIAFIFFVLIVPVRFVSGNGGREDTGRKAGLRVMTYNIHHCNPPSAGDRIDIEAIARVIRQEQPDLVALQEVDVYTTRSGKGVHQARELAKLTGMNFFFSKAIDYQGGEYGVAVLSRYPVLDSIRIALPVDAVKGGEPRTLAGIVVKPEKGPRLVFASTHLDLRAYNRLSQSRIIIDYFSGSALPVIIGGDFNAEPGSEEINLFDASFTRSCGDDCAGTIPVHVPSRTIDFIMFKPAGTFEVLSTRVISEKYASDHLPVITELRYK